MPRSLIISLILLPSSLFLLGGCGTGSAVKPIDDLPLACGMVPCECVSQGGGFFTSSRPQPLLWSADGRAGCPTGSRLRRIQ